MSEDRPTRVGCIGGGQLGRMMALEAPRLNIATKFVDPNPNCPASGMSPTIVASLDSLSAMRELAAWCDVVTIEIEHVGVEALKVLEAEGVTVRPSAGVVEIVRDKLIQKEHFAGRGVPVGEFAMVDDLAGLEAVARRMGLPLMLKSRKGGYDGRGNAVLRSLEEGESALAGLGGKAMAEKWVDFTCEVGVMVVRGADGAVASYPPTTAVQMDSVCRVVLAPARNLSGETQEECARVARSAVEALGEGAVGVFGVELFVTGQGVLLNEIAPRPHNTGHYTQDACAVSQFENHLRAVCGLELGDCSMTCNAAAMVNIMGKETPSSPTPYLSIPRSTLHLYQKSHRHNRKLGHINLTASSPAELQPHLSRALSLEDVTLPSSLSPAPLVGIVMGSASDLPTMRAAAAVLERFGIPHEVDVVSAHRTPEKLARYASTAAERGLEVIIAGAGGAAHLPGMIAAMTALPVVGVPVKTSTLNGIDSLLSIVQMPRGVPVATVAIGNAMNAGLLAVRILGCARKETRGRMEEYQREMKEMVDTTSKELTEIGSEKYLAKMENKSKEVNV